MSESSSTMSTKGMEKSYGEHSETQRSVIESASIYVQKAIDALDISNVPIVFIADFGSAHGSNSIKAMQSIIDTLKLKRKIDEDRQRIVVVHNDVPTNQWTSLFESLLKTSSYYGLASGRSFYDQCLPSSSLSIGYSSVTLHWLSCKPCNLTDRCLVDRNRNDHETNLFIKQAASDYDRFLECRSKELIVGGILVLSMIADQSGQDSNQHSDLLYSCAKAVLDEEECLDFTYPIFIRKYDEIVDRNLFDKHHFELIEADLKSIKTPSYQMLKSGQIDLDQYAHQETMSVRSACEFILRQTLTKNKQRTEQQVGDKLEHFWKLHEDGIKEKFELLDQDLAFVNVVLRKVSPK